MHQRSDLREGAGVQGPRYAYLRCVAIRVTGADEELENMPPLRSTGDLTAELAGAPRLRRSVLS